MEFVLPFLPDDDVITNYLEIQSVDESDKWYFDGIKLKKAGDLYRNFLNFYKLKFCQFVLNIPKHVNISPTCSHYFNNICIFSNMYFCTAII